MSDPTQTESRALAAIRGIIQSGRPLIYIQTAEEQRVAQLLRDASERLFSPALPIFSWSVTEGLQGPAGVPIPAGTENARSALDFIATFPQPAIFHLKDFHEPLRNSIDVRRRLRDLYLECFDRNKFVVLSSLVRFIPEEMSRDIVLFELPRPDFPEFIAFLEHEANALAKQGATIDPDPGVRAALARALMGLTSDEARHALRRAASIDRKIDTGSIRHLLEEKYLIIKKSGVIEFVPTTVDLNQVGGVGNLKKWVLERRKLFEMRDEVNKEIVPKGLLIMGVSGCGKSLAVKAISSAFGLPLYRIDMIEIFSGRHGNPEGTFADACHVMEEMSPAVVWFDEIEMGITSRNDDSTGALGRIFAFFLTWMQEKSPGLFVAATANRIDLLPAEMIRKGRFDEVFFVDLPGEDERMEIFKIHLKRRGIDPEAFAVDKLRQFTRGWSGAEVEQCVVSSMTQAQLQGRELTGDDLVNMTAKIVPLSRTMKEQVEHIREWALDRAVRAAPRAGERG